MPMPRKPAIKKQNNKDLIDSFHHYLIESDRERSARAYLGDVLRFINWFETTVGKFDAGVIHSSDAINYRLFLQTEAGKDQVGLAPTTVNRALVSLNIFFKWCHEEGYVNRNPMDNIKAVQISSITAPKWLTGQQQAALVEGVRKKGSYRDETIILLMLNTGLRVSEVTKLKWTDVRLKGQFNKLCVTGKGNKYREVPLNSTACKVLEDLRRQRTTCFPSETVFLNKYGQPISTRGVFKLISNYATNANLYGVTPHTLRHTFCKNAIDLGVSINQVAMIAGHSSLDTTKVYMVPSEKDLHDAVEKMVRPSTVSK